MIIGRIRVDGQVRQGQSCDTPKDLQPMGENREAKKPLVDVWEAQKASQL